MTEVCHRLRPLLAPPSSAPATGAALRLAVRVTLASCAGFYVCRYLLGEPTGTAGRSAGLAGLTRVGLVGESIVDERLELREAVTPPIGTQHDRTIVVHTGLGQRLRDAVGGEQRPLAEAVMCKMLRVDAGVLRGVVRHRMASLSNPGHAPIVPDSPGHRDVTRVTQADRHPLTAPDVIPATNQRWSNT
jgi:hypothetical protein